MSHVFKVYNENQCFATSKFGKPSAVEKLDMNREVIEMTGNTKLVNEALKFENKIILDLNKEHKVHIDTLYLKIVKLQVDKLYLESKLTSLTPEI